MTKKESERVLEYLISFSERASKCEGVLHKLNNLKAIKKIRGINHEVVAGGVGKIKIPLEYETGLKKAVKRYFERKLKFLNDKKKELKERLDKKIDSDPKQASEALKLAKKTKECYYCEYLYEDGDSNEPRDVYTPPCSSCNDYENKPSFRLRTWFEDNPELIDVNRLYKRMEENNG